MKSPINKIHYICDCDKNFNMNNETKAKLGRGKFSDTEIDDEGICVYCGHYAMTFKDLRISRKGDVAPIKIIEFLYGDETNRKKRRKDPFNGEYQGF